MANLKYNFGRGSTLDSDLPILDIRYDDITTSTQGGGKELSGNSTTFDEYALGQLVGTNLDMLLVRGIYVTASTVGVNDFITAKYPDGSEQVVITVASSTSQGEVALIPINEGQSSLELKSNSIDCTWTILGAQQINAPDRGGSYIKDMGGAPGSQWVLFEDGRVYISGKFSSGQMGSGDDIREGHMGFTPMPFSIIEPIEMIIMSDYDANYWTDGHTLFLTKSGSIFYVGNNSSGNDGMGLAHKEYTYPIEIPNAVGWVNEEGARISAFDVYHQGSILVDGVGDVYVTGYNGHGRLGLGHSSTVYTWTKVDIGTHVAVDCWLGTNEAYIRTDANVLLSCGRNGTGQLGIGSIVDKSTFQEMWIPIDKTVKEFTNSDHCAYMLTTDGRIYHVGENDFVYGTSSPNINNTLFIELTLHGSNVKTMRSEDTHPHDGYMWSGFSYINNDGSIYHSGVSDQFAYGAPNKWDAINNDTAGFYSKVPMEYVGKRCGLATYVRDTGGIVWGVGDNEHNAFALGTGVGLNGHEIGQYIPLPANWIRNP